MSQSLPIIKEQNEMPSYTSLETGLAEASGMVNDIILKKYLYHLEDMEIIPMNQNAVNINNIRLFKITEMVYQKNEYSTYKFASVFNTVQNLNCSVFVIADSDGKKTDFYMGVRSNDKKHTVKSLKNTLKNALSGQFPGIQTQDMMNSEATAFLNSISDKNIASVSCVAQNKSERFDNNSEFIQGLEKLILAMQGQKYTAIILADSTSSEKLESTRQAYETLYTQMSPFANMQLSYGVNTALSISNALSHGTTTGTSYSDSISDQTGKNSSQTKGSSETDKKSAFLKGIGSFGLSALSLLTATMTGGASIAVAGAINAGQMLVNYGIPQKQNSDSITHGTNNSHTVSKTKSINESRSDNSTDTMGITSGKSQNTQLTMQNKNLIDILQKIDEQLKRIDSCESTGMWECAAYFLSDTQETAEMAANTYKALMKGEKSGLETSAVNFWGRQKQEQLPVLSNYIKNFVHPLFCYHSEGISIPVTASSLVSGNELAIQMSFPRQSVCGFPVIEHAEFGKEVVKYQTNNKNARNLLLGSIFCMGTPTVQEVKLDCDSLTMHTFITGSTGSGKSNTIYEMLYQMYTLYQIPFLVVEPAKGEYKNVFGHLDNVAVYGTNPHKTSLLRLNPFWFPSDIHVLEHLDSLVEIFNVCWPMYAAMPDILKEAMERAYISCGWDMSNSINPKGNKFPNFTDLFHQVEIVINDSQYSVNSKGDYSGALLTRIRSLTNGLNRMLFCQDDLSDEALFNQNVIIDLSRIRSAETKSLIMGLLVMRLNEYRISSGLSNQPLRHVTVLEEAHHLLKRTSTAQSAESSNLLGKSVEMLTNSIAEMRTYGEGFIIADQSPNLLDMSVIRNTNTKIILRLPERNDRELVGYAANLNKEQIEEISKLKCGVAAAYQNDWVEPVLVQVNKCKLEEKPYIFALDKPSFNALQVRAVLLAMLVQGRTAKKLNFDIEIIRNGLSVLALSTSLTEFIESQINEYEQTGSLAIWKEEHFSELAIRITEIADVRNQIEKCLSVAKDDAELTKLLTNVAVHVMPTKTPEALLALIQYFMKDMTMRSDNRETRQKIYEKWLCFVTGKLA